MITDYDTELEKIYHPENFDIESDPEEDLEDAFGINMGNEMLPNN